MAYTSLLLLFTLIAVCACAPPHILVIVADDYGWDDIGYHASDLKTPNLDRLAAEGVKLENYYVQPLCTPSRSAFMTGRYPMRYGRQHEVIWPAQPSGLPLNETLLPQVLKQNGYSTHAIGKWHLGFFQWDYTPLRRGFDSFYGYYLGAEDYFLHNRAYNSMTGYDFRSQEAVYTQPRGIYSSHVFADEAVRIVSSHDASEPLFMYVALQTCHEPLQAPKAYTDGCSYVPLGDRRTYCGMVSTMDEAVKNITDAFIKAGIWDNTLMIFTTDNGGLPSSAGYNWPLRGGKGTLFEGGVRGVSFVRGSMLNNPGTENHKLMHIVDWFPTILQFAGIAHENPTGFEIDGLDFSKAVNSDSPSLRTIVLLNLDPLGNTSAIRVGDWKLIEGVQPYYGWYRPPNITADDLLSPDASFLGLYNVSGDPNERHDLSAANPDVVAKLRILVQTYSKGMMAPWYPADDPSANPANFGGSWSPWQ